MICNSATGSAGPMTAPTGWTLFANAESSLMSTAAFYRIADGGEGSTASVGLDGSQGLAAVTMRITGGDTPEAATPGAGNSGSINPPAITPSGGSQEYLWLASCGFRSSGAINTTPTGYTSVALADDGGSIRTYVYEKTSTASSEDPGDFDFDTNNAWSTWTIAVPPAAAGVNVSAPAKSYSLSGQVPAVGTGVDVGPPAKAFTLTGQVPAVGTGALVAAPLGAYVLTGFAPGIGLGATVAPPAGSFSLSGQVPAVAAGKNVAVPAGSYTLTGLAPTIAAGATTVNTPSYEYTLTGNAPTIATGVNVLAPAKAFILTAFIPLLGTVKAAIMRTVAVLRELRMASVPRPVDETGVRIAVADPESRMATVAPDDRSTKA